MAQNLRIFVLPMFAHGGEQLWYGWLKKRLEARKKFPMESYTIVELAPDKEKPIISDCVTKFKAAIGSKKDDLARTAIIGHSIGAQVALRTLSELPAGSAINGLLCVAGWLKLDLPTKAVKPWIEIPFDEARAKVNAKRILNVISGSDANQMNALGVQEDWDKRLGAEVKIVREPGHFSNAEEEDVLNATLEFFGK
jgi:predicted alpha/beta hydrolase family esterase